MSRQRKTPAEGGAGASGDKTASGAIDNSTHNPLYMQPGTACAALVGKYHFEVSRALYSKHNSKQLEACDILLDAFKGVRYD